MPAVVWRAVSFQIIMGGLLFPPAISLGKCDKETSSERLGHLSELFRLKLELSDCKCTFYLLYLFHPCNKGITTHVQDNKGKGGQNLKYFVPPRI